MQHNVTGTKAGMLLKPYWLNDFQHANKRTIYVYFILKYGVQIQRAICDIFKPGAQLGLAAKSCQKNEGCLL